VLLMLLVLVHMLLLLMLLLLLLRLVIVHVTHMLLLLEAVVELEAFVEMLGSLFSTLRAAQHTQAYGHTTH
jgi:hypothetical protein